MLLNNVCEPLDIDFQRESLNEHDDKSLKETETQRNAKLSKNNNIPMITSNRKRPSHFITEKYIQNQPKTPRIEILSGNRSYASTTDYGKNIFVIGDSHIKRINRKRFSNSFKKAKSFIKFFPRAKIQKIEHYVVPHLMVKSQMYPLMHIGDNIIHFKAINDINLKKIAEDIINLGKIWANFGSEMFISSILIKKNNRLNSVIRNTNDELEELCTKYNFYRLEAFYVVMMSLSQIMVWIF